MKLLEKLKNRQDDLNSHVDKYFKYIEGSLVKENELTSYEELNQLEVKSLSTLELKRKMNEFVGDHSWILELNAKGKSSGEVEAIELATEAIRQKYEKLSRRL